MNVLRLRRLAPLAAACFAGAVLPVAAQTITLTSGNATTLRGGAYASKNYGNDSTVETRASSDPSYERRTLLKFDTQNTTETDTPIQSATLTLTVAAGSNSQSRQLTAYQVITSYDQDAATWTSRKSGTKWSSAGGDLGARYAVATATGTTGSKIVFDVTALVKAIVRGDFGSSRYTRFMIVDDGGSSRDSYKAMYSDEAAESVRPTLKIVTGTTTTTTTPPPTSTSTSTSTMRVLEWNTHHGGFGTDGKYNPDRLATWVAKMKPDVVLLNEIEKYTGWGNQDQPAVYERLLESKTGKTWYGHFAQEFGNWSSNGKGNLILSTVPFSSTDRYELVHNGDRSLAEATITWNGRKITFLLTHLDPDSKSLRLTQASEVTTYALAQPENKIVAGDMNAWPDQTSIAQYNKYFYDSWAVALGKGTATAFSGNEGLTKNGRIDYIFYSKQSPDLKVKSSQVYDTRDSNGVMPSDHRPVLTTFEVR